MSDSWVVKFPWRRKWQPLQDSCLENPMDRGAWLGTVHRVTKELDVSQRLKKITNNNKACGMLLFPRYSSIKTMNSDDMLDEYRGKKIFLIILIFYFIVRIFRLVTCYFIRKTYLVILFSFNTDKSVYIVATLCVVKIHFFFFFGLKS